MRYPGAEIEERDDGWWIVFDGGEDGPFLDYDHAALVANCNDDEDV